MDVAETWRTRWKAIGFRADEAKDGSSVLPKLFAAYRSLTQPERVVVDGVLAEAVESDDETDRYDALALVREFGIASAAPSLERLAERLESTQSPGASYELENVNEILRRLVKYRECDVVRVVKLGLIDKYTEGGVPPEWAIGREGIFDSYFPDDGVVMVWLDEPVDGWSMWIFEEDDLEPTGKTAPQLPDDWE